jgi:hypothetical protein
MSNVNLRLKTCMTTTGMSANSWPGCNCDWISGHWKVHVIVMKKKGFPSAAAIAKESAICLEAHHLEPKKKAGR